METLLDFDTRLFCWINQHDCTTADHIMWVASQGWSWAVVLLAVLAAVTLRHEPRRWWVVLLGIGLCFLASDRISVMCFKDVFQRLRPCHVLDDVNMFRTSCGGLYGFVSSHAANVCSLAMFLSLRYRRQFNPHWLFPVLMGLWAVLVCYSRPYLGKHYPGDVLCGALLGIAIGTAVFFAMQLIDRRIDKRTNEKKLSLS